MGELVAQGAPINEAVYLLDKLNPEALKTYRTENREIAEMLEPGIWAGTESEMKSDRGSSDDFAYEKAKFVLAAVKVSLDTANRGIITATKRISFSRKLKLYSGILVLLGSSGILGALALKQQNIAIISAIITLFSSIGNLISDHLEKIINPKSGNVYDVYQNLVESRNKLNYIKSELTLALKYRLGHNEINVIVANANEKIGNINRWFPQIITNWL